MLGRQVRLAGPPQRIVSLCPSITETLFVLGLDARIAGLTRYCIHPEDRVQGKASVGGTKRLKFEVIEALQPDLIIAEKEENNRGDVERLAEQYPVYVTEVVDIPGAFDMIERLGQVCGEADKARQLAAAIDGAWQKLPVLSESLKVAYLIWRKPFMAAGSGTFIDAVLQRLGFDNVFAGADRYPEFTLQMLAAENPDVVLLSSEPYPFRDKHQIELEMLLPQADIMLVDGEAFSWYGSHMLDAARYLERFLRLL